jgi:hypothetical protein
MAIVYALICRENGFAYVGVTSSKWGKRAREHKCLLRNNKHHARKLQEDWLKYPASSFEMIPLEETEYSSRGAHCEAEQKWINHYSSLGKLYNEHNRSAGLGGEITLMGVEASKAAIGNRWSPEANAKRSLSQLGKPKGHGAKISATKQAKKQVMM